MVDCEHNNVVGTEEGPVCTDCGTILKEEVKDSQPTSRGSWSGLERAVEKVREKHDPDWFPGGGF